MDDSSFYTIEENYKRALALTEANLILLVSISIGLGTLFDIQNLIFFGVGVLASIPIMTLCFSRYTKKHKKLTAIIEPIDTVRDSQEKINKNGN